MFLLSITDGNAPGSGVFARFYRPKGWGFRTLFLAWGWGIRPLKIASGVLPGGMVSLEIDFWSHDRSLNVFAQRAALNNFCTKGVKLE